MSVASDAAPEPLDAAGTKARERRAIGVASGAHALHDGYTDLVYVLLPLWQSEFGLGYTALGLLRTCFSGTMAGLQIPSALLSERLGVPMVLAAGTALSGLGYLIAGTSAGFVMLVVALLIGGLGSSTQHPLASALVARAYAGPRSLKALGTYNFAGDIGKMSVPAPASLLLVVMAWRPVVGILGFAGLVAGVAIYALTPTFATESATASAGDDKAIAAESPATRSRTGFALLLAIG